MLSLPRGPATKKLLCVFSHFSQITDTRWSDTRLFILHIHACYDALHLSTPRALISVISHLSYLPKQTWLISWQQPGDMLCIFASAVFFPALIKEAGNDPALFWICCEHHDIAILQMLFPPCPLFFWSWHLKTFILKWPTGPLTDHFLWITEGIGHPTIHGHMQKEGIAQTI